LQKPPALGEDPWSYSKLYTKGLLFIAVVNVM